MTARNRIVVSPMCQYRSIEGAPTDWHLVHLGRFAIGGAGIVFTEDSAVEARGRSTHRCAGMYDDRFIAPHRRITAFIREMGAVPAIQIGHVGRVASTRGPIEQFAPLTEADRRDGLAPWQPVAASPGPVRPNTIEPLVLDREEIKRIVGKFAAAARRAVEAGYEICEVHGAHGYLIHQFLSPGSNRRTDDYGGSLTNRMRFALDVVEAVRAVWPQDRPLFFRMSCVEGKGGVWGMQDSLTLGRELVARGVDVIDCSSGGIGGESEMPPVPRVPGFQVGYSDRIRKSLGCMTMAVGMILEGRQAEKVLAQGSADLLAIASEMMLDPNWPVRAAEELGLKDRFNLLPDHHAFRLARRDKMRQAYPAGHEVRIPHETNETKIYRWT